MAPPKLDKPKPHSSSHRNDNQKRRAATAMTLVQFAHSKSKGTSRAIKHYRDKKQRQFNRRAGMLREYKKVMKSEGYEAGIGASRKRPDKVNHDDTTSANDTDDANKSQPIHRKHKSDPLAKAKAKAMQRQAEKELAKHQLQEKNRIQEQKMRNRRVRSKQMSRRTRKGQPVMKNIIGGMLDKIQKEVGAGVQSEE